MVHGLDVRVVMPGLLAMWLAFEINENKIFVYAAFCVAYAAAHLVCRHFEKKACLAEEEQSEV